MADINNIQVTGNLGGDPKLEFYDDGATAVAEFTVAQYVGAKDKEEKSVPRWWNVRIRSKVSQDGKWKSAAEEAIEQLKKGNKVVISGRINGWIPNSEYEKEEKWDGYARQVVMNIEASAFLKVDVPQKQSNRDEMPPF